MAVTPKAISAELKAKLESQTAEQKAKLDKQAVEQKIQLDNVAQAGSLRYQKITTVPELNLLKYFIKLYRIQCRNIKAADTNAVLFFDLGQNTDHYLDYLVDPKSAQSSHSREWHLDHQQYFLRHPVSGFYMFFEGNAKLPIGMMMLWDVDKQGFIQESVAFFQDKTGKGYGKKALAMIHDKVKPFFRKKIQNLEDKMVVFKGVFADVDIRNQASLALFATATPACLVSDYVHRVINAEAQHFLSFACPSEKPASDLSEETCELSKSVKEERLLLLKGIAPDLRASIGRTAQAPVLNNLQAVVLPLYQRHKTIIDTHKTAIHTALGSGFSTGTNDVQATVSKYAAVLKIIEGYYISPAIKWAPEQPVQPPMQRDKQIGSKNKRESKHKHKN